MNEISTFFVSCILMFYLQCCSSIILGISDILWCHSLGCCWNHIKLSSAPFYCTAVKSGQWESDLWKFEVFGQFASHSLWSLATGHLECPCLFSLQNILDVFRFNHNFNRHPDDFIHKIIEPSPHQGWKKSMLWSVEKLRTVKRDSKLILCSCLWGSLLEQ